MMHMIKKIGLSLLLMLSVTAGYGQRTYDEFFLEAMMQRQKGNNDAAFDLLRHCLEINPNAPVIGMQFMMNNGFVEVIDDESDKKTSYFALTPKAINTLK